MMFKITLSAGKQPIPAASEIRKRTPRGDGIRNREMVAGSEFIDIPHVVPFLMCQMLLLLLVSVPK